MASSRLMVLMFTDLVESTRLKRELGPEAYRSMMQRHDEFIRRALSVAPTGRILQDTGDGYFVTFDNISDAISAALAFQWLMHQEPWPARFFARVGLHLGQVEQSENPATGQPKLLASAADVAARVMSLAQGGQLLLTRAVFDEARLLVRAHPPPGNGIAPPALRWVAHGPYQFKGSDEPFDVFEVGAEGVAPFSPPPDSEKAKRYIRPGDELTLGWRPAVGKQLENNPNWVLTKKLGEGGFGEVWLAQHDKLKTPRVLKFCFDAERLRGLKREVLLFRLLKDALGERRDISRLIDWQFDTPPYFIETDYTPDGNLIDWAAAQGGIGTIALERRVEIVAQIARALGAAHSVAILHKDIKPSNILIVKDAGGAFYPRLTDFGIGILTDRSRLERGQITAAGFTTSNVTMNDSSRTGSRMYAPPESLADKPHTVQGDIYALGVLFYQMLTADLYKPLGPGWERDVSDELLRESVAACIDADPSRRVSSAEALANALETLDQRRRGREEQTRLALETQAFRARELEARRLAARRRIQVRALGTAAGVLAVVSAVIVVLWRESRSQRIEADGQRTVATREAENARRQEESAKRNLGQLFVADGWSDVAHGDESLALSKFAAALRLCDTPARRLPVQSLLARWARPCDLRYFPRTAVQRSSDDSFCHWSADGLRWLEYEDKVAIVRDAATNRQLSAPMSHTSRLAYAAISRDGSRVLTLSEDNTARVWNAVSGAPMGSPMKHEDRVNRAAFSPDGKRIVTAGDDRTARVWDAATGQQVGTPLKHANLVFFAAFSPDGTRVVTASGDHTARVWDAATGDPVGPPLMHERLVFHAAFSPDGTKVATAGGDKTARVWDAVTGQPASPILRHDDNHVTYVGFSPDGGRIVTLSGAKMVRVWDAVTGAPASPPLKHQEFVEDLAFSPDGTRIVTASHDQSARVWDAATGQFAHPPFKQENLGDRAAFSPDGTYVVTAGRDTAPRIWEVAISEPFSISVNHKDWVNRAAFSPDGMRIVTASLDNTAFVWDAATGQPLTPPLKHEILISDAAFDPGGQKILTIGGKTARLWDATTGEQVGPPLEHEAIVRHGEFSPDGAKVVTASDDNTARLWDAGTGLPVTPPLKHDGWVYSAAFSGDGRRIVTASWDKTARLWDAGTGQALSPPLRHESVVTYAIFSPDGRRVLTISAAKTGHAARIWDTVTSQPLGPPLKHEGVINHASFSPDGMRVLSASHDKTARLWDASTGRPLLPPLKHDDAVNHASFSPDGTMIVTASDDGAARIWDAGAGQPLSPPLRHRKAVVHASFSPDGGRVVTASADGSSKVWELLPDKKPIEDILKRVELLLRQRITEDGGGIDLTSEDWRARFDDLSARYPQEFLPRPTEQLLNFELSRIPSDPKRLKMFGESFHKRNENTGAAQLLATARAGGAEIDAVLLARCYWMAHQYTASAVEFQKAIAVNTDPKQDSYLKQCLAAVRRAAAKPAARK